MKILVTSDFHGDFSCMRSIVEYAVKNPVEGIFICGDLVEEYDGENFSLQQQKQLKDYLKLRELFDRTNTKWYYIFGNNDLFVVPKDDEHYLPSGNKLFFGYSLIPFEMIVAPKNCKDNEKDIAYSLSMLSITEKSIVVAHQPPYGCLDKNSDGENCGSISVREMILKNRPYIYLCGHMHEARGTQYLGETLVLNCSIGNGHHAFVICLEDRGVVEF